MKSIRANLVQIQKRKACEQWGTYPCLVEVVQGKQYNRRTIYDNFIKLMPKDEYEAGDTAALVRQLHSVSNTPEDSTSEVKNPLREEKQDLMAPASSREIQIA